MENNKKTLNIESLNDIYSQNRLFYWCNACGEINMPGDPVYPILVHKPNELPNEQLRDLYNNFWSELGCSSEYVVTLDGVHGYAFDFLFDYDWAEDNGMNPKKLPEVIKKTATQLFADVQDFVGCRFLFGEDTDPNGHEFIIFLPYERRKFIEPLRAAIQDGKYDMWDAIIYPSAHTSDEKTLYAVSYSWTCLDWMGSQTGDTIISNSVFVNINDARRLMIDRFSQAKKDAYSDAKDIGTVESGVTANKARLKVSTPDYSSVETWTVFPLEIH